MRRLVILLAAVLTAILCSVNSAAGNALSTPTWKAQQIPVPDHLSTALTSDSCVTSKFCVAIGGQIGAAWDAGKWIIVPNAAKPFEAVSVSCATPVTCMAVGSIKGSTDRWLYAEIWNGTKWSLAKTPLYPPGGAADNGAFTSVSCTTGFVCVAAGYYSDASSGPAPFAEVWNTSKWALAAPLPTPKGSDMAQLSSVSCASPVSCLAVGDYYTDFDELEFGLAEQWDGAGWTNVSPGQRLNAQPMTGVSCVLKAWCMAVGSSPDSHDVDILAGLKWTVTQEPFTIPTFTSLSCTSSTFCMAIDSTTSYGYTYSWNGTKWRNATSSTLNGATLSSVSCTSSTACTAVGYVPGSVQGNTKAFAARYSSG